MKQKLILALAVVFVLSLSGVLAFAAAVAPTVNTQENLKCSDFGYSHFMKLDQGTSGVATDGYNSVTVTVNPGPSIDFTSTISVDLVLVKGGPVFNVYDYRPGETSSDTGLTTPTNPNNDQPYGLSHVEFCYDYEVSVSKTATTTFTRTWHWTIDKSVNPDTLNMFTGDTGTVLWTVAVTKTGYTDSDFSVSGTITIHNPDPSNAASITGVVDEISGVGQTAVNCPSNTVAPLSDLVCTYGPTSLPNGESRTNTATVSTSGPVGGSSGSAPITFGAPTTQVNAEVDVTDTNGGSWQFGDSGSTSYTEDFTCDGDEGQHTNTATITQTGQSDSATTTVNCYALEVGKTVVPSRTREWTWTIDKSADQADLTLATGQSFVVNYDVTVTAHYTESFGVSGVISVHNPAPIPANIGGVSDIVSPDIVASVNCGVAFPYMLGAGETLQCAYTADLPDAFSRTNTATATLLNVPGGSTNFSFTANVDFAGITSEIDECVDVSDTFGGALGTVCATSQDQTFPFSYAHTVGPYEVCGDYTVDNIASFVTNDTGATGSDSVSIPVNVPCEGGCTLTQGYWRTHSSYGPAPYDDIWALIGEDTQFFNNVGTSWYQILWLPVSGDPYLILAKQYIAAYLNGLNEADDSAISTTMTTAYNLLNQYNLGGVPSNKRSQFTQTAAILDNYNNGLIGPGHCSEQS